MSRKRGGTSKAEDKAAKEAMFVERYCQNGGIGAKAYVQAGFKAKNPNVAAVQANRLLRKPNIGAAIAIRRAQSLEKAQEETDITAKEVLRSGARDIRFDPAKLYYTEGEKKGQLKPVWELDEATRAALRGMEHDEIAVGRGAERMVVGHTSKVKFPEKTAARDQLMKHFGLYEEHNKQQPAATVSVGVLTVQPDGLNFAAVRARIGKRS